jgi:hypothetical protein
VEIALTKTVRIILSLFIVSSTGLNLGSRCWADDATDENRAIELVFNSPKVRIFLKKMTAVKQPVGAMTERKSKCVFNVRVFEDRPDHIATPGVSDKRRATPCMVSRPYVRLAPILTAELPASVPEGANSRKLLRVV